MADKCLGFQAGAPAKEQRISSVGHHVAVESSPVVPVVSALHHLSEAHLPGTTQSHSKAQHCARIGCPCSATYGQWNHNRRRTGSWPPERRVGWIGWHASRRRPSHRRWIYSGRIYSIDICILQVESCTLENTRSWQWSPFVWRIAAHPVGYFPPPCGSWGVNPPVSALAHGCFCWQQFNTLVDITEVPPWFWGSSGHP